MTTNKPEAAHLADARAEFEAWITSPPYEKPVTINPESSAWPGQYQAYEVQLAWEAYQAARAAPQEKLARLQAVVDEEVAELLRLGQKKRAAHLHYLAQIATRD